jgi:hypothetical protein
MTKSVRLLLMGAALTGFVAGQNALAQATGGDKKDDTKKSDDASGKKATKTKKDKHACKGQNSCKGKGGCGETKGKNDCKGKGGCRTDGKPMEKEGAKK